MCNYKTCRNLLGVHGLLIGPRRAPRTRAPGVESRVLQEDVGARSSDGERRGADQLNLELRRRIPIGAAR